MYFVTRCGDGDFIRCWRLRRRLILINAAIGFFAGHKAVCCIEALRRLDAAITRERRDSVITAVPAEHLVPGDIVLREAGDVIAANVRPIAASGLE
jgi:P-type Ca2+ transporter type 2C